MAKRPIPTAGDVDYRGTKKQRPMLSPTIEVSNVVELLSHHEAVLVSGAAGTGKSFLLSSVREYIDQFKPDWKVASTAPTGIAAANIDGQTLHNFIGAGLAYGSIFKLLKRMTYGKDNLKQVTLLIIDEISMVHTTFFQTVDKLAQKIRGNSRPFGGIKLLMVGDFLQLPPINCSVYLFESTLWRELNVQRIFLRHIYRQTDAEFGRLLNKVRVGNTDSVVIDALKKRIDYNPNAIQICTYRNTAERRNDLELFSLPGEYFTHDAIWSKAVGTGYQPASFAVSFTSLPIPNQLILKANARVILRTNKLGGNLFNGSVGVVIDPGIPSVDFNGRVINIKRQQFSYKRQMISYRIDQVPLIIGYAITVHMSQGVTLDTVQIDCNSFECGQAYVAMSRCKTLSGLYLSDLQPSKIKANQKAVAFEEDFLFPLLIIGGKKAPSSTLARHLFSSELYDANVLYLIKQML
jgi:ATP-dependent DNA helicase PIF1